MFLLLLSKPFIKIGPVVDVEDVMVALRKDCQLRMAAGGFHGANQSVSAKERALIQAWGIPPGF
jgi:hypothetical protein